MKKKEQKTDNELVIDKMRHSGAHVLAQAVLEMFPEAKLAIGPPIEHGFYYDFDLPRNLIPEDLPIIEEKMKRIQKEGQKFEQYTEPKDKAIQFLKATDQQYKVEMAQDLEDNELGFYVNIDKDGNKTFVDMCRGPHVENTKQIGYFKLTSIAGAYWRGDEKRKMLQRVYAISFPTKEELNQHLEMLEEAKKRDHRILGKKLELFTFDEEVGAGLPLWLPNGAVVANELEKLAVEQEDLYGYQRVRTPHLAKEELYKRSGHLPYYADSMYPPMKLENETYYLKAMNCPHHHKIYKFRPRSYRELPLRLAEYGHCYRFEDSGALFGLMRVRSLCMNDAHIYCTEDQFEEEFIKVLDMYKYYFDLFGIEKYSMRLSKHSKEGLGKKYVDNEKLWIKTEAWVKKALDNAKVPYTEVDDEAAFYGPKIDVQIWSAIGREFTLATNQLDFAVPERFELTYIDSDGQEKTPICIHRAPLSTHERFIGFLIEHYAGAFPTWLAPLQVKILPISDKHLEIAEKIRAEFKKDGIRVEVDDRSESLGRKVRDAEMMKIPYMLVIGDKEAENKSVTVRKLNQKEQETVSVAEFKKMILHEIKTRLS